MKNQGHKLQGLIRILIPVLVLVLGWFGYKHFFPERVVTVGFIYDNDETAPYSYNFYLAQEAVQKTYQNKVRTVMCSNVLDEQIHLSVQKLVDGKCDIIFTNSYGNIRDLAVKYPHIQFCQASFDPKPQKAPDNYHTFKGEAYQGRYVSGVVAGLKLEEMIKKGKIKPEEAKLGFVAAYPYPEVISGYTAFLLGARSVVPQTVMFVKYTNIWDSYTLEKACAEELLEEGCVILSQHSDTVGPAIACEESYARDVYHVAYNIDMTDAAPHTSLTGTRINWTPYILGAVNAVMENKPIEKTVAGNVHPNNDMSAGFKENWIEMTKLNTAILPEGARSRIDAAIEDLKTGKCQVFQGDYTGVNPNDPKDTVDLRNGFTENKESSVSSFHYVLKDVITVLQ
jgi:basic membrane protein A